MASIDYGDYHCAKLLFSLINNDFPKETSNRCLKLQLMMFENSQPEVVQEEREILQKSNDADQSLIKRIVALLIENGETEKAISELTKHVETFALDEDSWLCLADLYLDLGKYDKAAFCLEEMIMYKPFTAHYHIRLAEIYYTWASLDNNINTTQTKDSILENYLNSKAHYSYAVNLTLKQEIPNLRALFGWMQAAKMVNSMRNLKNDSEKKLVCDENFTINYMTSQLVKYNLKSFNNGSAVKDYLEEINLENLSLSGQ